MLERRIDVGVTDFDKLNDAMELYWEQHKDILERYDLRLSKGIAAERGYYIALIPGRIETQYDRLGLAESFMDIPVAIRRRHK